MTDWSTLFSKADFYHINNDRMGSVARIHYNLVGNTASSDLAAAMNEVLENGHFNGVERPYARVSFQTAPHNFLQPTARCGTMISSQSGREGLDLATMDDALFMLKDAGALKGCERDMEAAVLEQKKRANGRGR